MLHISSYLLSYSTKAQLETYIKTLPWTALGSLIGEALG